MLSTFVIDNTPFIDAILALNREQRLIFSPEGDPFLSYELRFMFILGKCYYVLQKLGTTEPEEIVCVTDKDSLDRLVRWFDRKIIKRVSWRRVKA